MNRNTLLALAKRVARNPTTGMTGISDRELLSRFIETKDDAAFAELVRRNGPMVWAVSRQLLPSQADAEDGVQATFLALIQSAKKIRNDANPGAWLYGVAVRVAAKLKRSAARRKQREERASRPESVCPVSNLEWAELYERVHEEVLQLPETMRAAFILSEIQGFNLKSAAVQLGCTPNAVATRLSKARRKLLAALAKKGIAPTIATGLIGIGSMASAAFIPPRLFGLIESFANVERGTRPAHLLTLAQEVMAMNAVRSKLLAASLLSFCGVAFVGVSVMAFAKSDAREPHDVPAKATDSQSKGPSRSVPEPECKVTGTVRMADGSPAAEAVVWAAQYTLSPLVRREIVADKAGKFELKLGAGTWFIWARKGTQGGEGIAPDQSRQFKIESRVENVSVDIKLEERGKLKGKLFAAESGKPIAGGRLFLDNGVVVITDANGQFEIGGLTRKNHEAFAVCAGRIRQRVLFDTTAKPVTEVEVPLAVAAKIVGRVTDEKGNPIPGAWVGRYTSGSYFSINGLFQACAADGTYEYDDAVSPDQPTRLVAGAPGYIADQNDRIHAAPAQPAKADFKLIPDPKNKVTAAKTQAVKRRVVSGSVKGPDGKPVANVLVRWGYQPYFGAEETKTDAAGEFKFTVPDEKNFLAILPRDYQPFFTRVADGGDDRIEAQLKEGNTASGAVEDDEGKPIANVRVIALTRSPDPAIGNPFWLNESSAQTDARGQFEIKGVPDGARFDVLKEGHSEQRNLTLNLNGAANTIKMQYGGAVKGRVLDVNGKPVRNFRITVSSPRNPQAGDNSAGYFAGYSGIGVRFTSEDGSFVLTGVGAGGVYRIRALADGVGEAVVDRVTAVPINHLSKTEASIIRAAAPTQLKVKVFNADGEPIPEARVTLIDGEPNLDQSFLWGYHDASWENMVRARTDAKGLSDFPALSFSEATLVVQAPGKARYRMGWRDRAKQIEVKLQPESVLSGTLVFPNGGFADGVYVNLLCRTATSFDQITTSVSPLDKGKFHIEGLFAGKWTVTLRDAGPSGESVNAVIEIKDGEKKEWTYEWIKK